MIRIQTGIWTVRTASESEKSNIDIKQQGNKIYIKAVKAGVYNWKKADKDGTISVNLPFNETDISPKKTSFKRTSINLKSNLSKIKIPIEKIPLSLFLILLIIEWFLWIGIPFKKGVK